MLSDLTYRRLCRQVQERDPECIAELYDMYGPALYGVILRIVKSEEPSVEILQDTFTKVWKKGHSYDPDSGRLYTWMMRIARNGAINYTRSKSSVQRKRLTGDGPLVYLHDQSRQVSNVEICDLKGAVTSLDTKYKTVIDLIYYQGYTHQEVSDELQVPLGTVKSRIRIALRELKKIYDYGCSLAFVILISLTI